MDPNLQAEDEEWSEPAELDLDAEVVEDEVDLLDSLTKEAEDL